MSDMTDYVTELYKNLQEVHQEMHTDLVSLLNLIPDKWDVISSTLQTRARQLREKWIK